MVLDWLKGKYEKLSGKEEAADEVSIYEWTFDDWTGEIASNSDLDELWDYMEIIEDSKMLTEEGKKTLIASINKIFDDFIGVKPEREG